LTPNYSYDAFNEFIHFSSAKNRIENFIQKLSLIESYENDLSILSSITGSTSGSNEIISNKTILENKITNVIQNFDGYEYYLYFDSGSSSFPKQNSIPPYIPFSTTSSEATTWLGTDNEIDPLCGGIILSASFYDNKNQNNLLYTVPEFIRENTDNSQYVLFVNMIGHYFDEIWLYTKNITEKLNNTNELDKGVPLDLISKTIESFGFNLIGTNLNNLDNTIGFLGQESGSFTPSTGSEYITDYIAVNQNNSTNYWNPEIETFDFPYPTDNIGKEIMKRLYHNMVYLLKKKGTVSGLRQLINCWGIPSTILRINEFGGKNKDNTNDYDYWYERYSYAFKTNASSSVRIPWMPLERNRIVDDKHIVPDVIEFRFKTPTILPTSSITQPILFKKSNSTTDSTVDFLLSLNYSPLTTSSYSGSNDLQYEKYGTLTFQLNGSSTASLYLPFYNGDWWSVMIRRNAHIDSGSNGDNISYNLIAQNKIYIGSDGNETGYFDSAELNAYWYPPEYGGGIYGESVYGGFGDGTTMNAAWNDFGTSSLDGVYLGGWNNEITVNSLNINESSSFFEGYFQEFRYYSHPISTDIFNDFTMNPESIEGETAIGLSSSFDILNFRAPLGNLLEDKWIWSIPSSSYYTSNHPAITGSINEIITASFYDPTLTTTSSLYEIITYTGSIFSEPNRETYFLDQPSVGSRNRISNKIESSPDILYGDVLSIHKSLQQDYQKDDKYTPDNNNLEVAFSPQEEINDDIIQTLGFNSISNTIANPDFLFESSNEYDGLKEIAEYYFKKYKKGNIYDYLRLIKYFDNSIFKAIKNYVPARTSLTTGIVIKQHLLERNRVKVPKPTYEDQQYTSSIEIGNFEGGTGGVLEKFNYTGSNKTFGDLDNTQIWNNTFDSIVGLQTKIQSTQDEFYNGEFSGSQLQAEDGELNPSNPVKYPNVLDNSYYVEIIPYTLQSQSMNVEFTQYGFPTQRGVINTEIFNTNLTSSNIIKLYLYEQISASIYAYNVEGISISTTTGSLLYNYLIEAINTNGQELNPAINKDFPFLGDRTVLNQQFKSLGPYFTFNISGSNIGSELPLIGIEQSYKNIISSTLRKPYIGKSLQKWNSINEDKIFSIFPPPPPGAYIPTGIVTFNFRYARDTNVNGNTRNQSRGIHPPQFNLTSPCIFTPGATVLYFNSSNYAINDIITNKINTNQPNTASLYLYDSRMYGKNFPESWVPIAIKIPYFDIDGNNNRNTIVNNPNWKITLPYEELPGTITPIKYDNDTSNLEPNVISNEYLTLYQQINNIPEQHSSFIFSKALLQTEPPVDSRRNNLSGSNFYISEFFNTQASLGFNPIIPSDFNYINSDFNPLYGNYVDSRENKYLQNVEYFNGIQIPNNIEQINNNIAVKTQTPDSNYTAESFTRIKYNGSKLISNDYNTKYPRMLTGSIFRQRGEAIDKYPTYLGYFDFSYPSAISSSLYFNVSKLIEIPNNETTLTDDSYKPTIIKIDGSDIYTSYIHSIFEKNRKASILYNSSSLDFGTLENKLYNILPNYTSGSNIVTLALTFDYMWMGEGTPRSTDGFLIPNDLSTLQKRYVESLIVKLRNQRAFTKGTD